MQFRSSFLARYLGLLLAANVIGTSAAWSATWSDDFESYSIGENVSNRNGWDWDLSSGSATVMGDDTGSHILETHRTRTDDARFVGSVSVTGPFTSIQTWAFQFRVPAFSGTIRPCNVYLDMYTDGGRACRFTLGRNTDTSLKVSHNGPTGWQQGPQNLLPDVWYTTRLSLDVSSHPDRYRVELPDAGYDSGWWDAYGTSSSCANITFLQEGADSVFQWDNWTGPDPVPAGQVLYTTAKPSGYDAQVFTATLQGLANRSEPRLFLDSGSNDAGWLARSTGTGEWLSGRIRVPLSGLSALLDVFAPIVRGVVVWDPDVPATVNAATTAAGILDAVVVMGSDIPGSLFDLCVNTRQIPVLLDLRHRFTGTGNIWDTDLPSTGSPKVDTYLWAKAKYIDTGQVDPTLIGLMEDAYPLVAGTEIIHTLDRDIVVARKGFAVDLNPWPNETEGDDPGQPVGAEYPAYVSILDALRARAGNRVLDMVGYLPYKDKYTNNHGGTSTGSVGSSSEGPGEWQNVRLLSSRGGTLWAEQNCPNMSFWRHAPPIGYNPQNPRPKPQSVEPLTYVLFMNGDWDGPTGLYEYSPGYWNAGFRTSSERNVPLAWSFNPNLSEMYPEQFRFFWKTRTAYDFFVGSASGAGYSMPNELPTGPREAYANRARRLYGLLDVGVALFNIDTAPPLPAVKDAWSTFSKDGFGYIWVDGSRLQPPYSGPASLEDHLSGASQMAVVNLFGITGEGYSGRSFEESVAYAAAIIYGIVPRFGDSLGKAPHFLAVRATGSVAWWQALRDYLVRDKPTHRYEVVDPWTFFYLRRQTLGGTNTGRSSVLEGPGTVRARAGEPFSVSIVLRNNGWDTWENWFSIESRILSSRGERISAVETELPQAVSPGQSVSLATGGIAPQAAGMYRFQVDVGEFGAYFSETGSIPYEATLEVVAPGDGDGDGQITVADVALALRMVSGLSSSTPLSTSALDLNADGMVTLVEALAVNLVLRP